jgi:hypothetical protein
VSLRTLSFAGVDPAETIASYLVDTRRNRFEMIWTDTHGDMTEMISLPAIRYLAIFPGIRQYVSLLGAIVPGDDTVSVTYSTSPDPA